MKTLPTPIERWNQLMAKRKLGSNAITVFDLEVNYDAFIRFIQLTLNLGQFVPTNKKGEPMKKPLLYENFRQADKALKSHQDWQEALDRVIFPRFEIRVMADNESFRLCNSDIEICHYNATINIYDWGDFKTIESLIPLGVQVTDTKAEELKL